MTSRPYFVGFFEIMFVSVCGFIAAQDLTKYGPKYAKYSILWISGSNYNIKCLPLVLHSTIIKTKY